MVSWLSEIWNVWNDENDENSESDYPLETIRVEVEFEGVF